MKKLYSFTIPEINKVDVLEMTEDATFEQMFDKKQTLTQGQILYFIKKNRGELGDYYSTFFLFESRGNFFVASVDSNSGGKLNAHVHHFGYSYVWNAGARHRVVVPKLHSCNHENWTFETVKICDDCGEIIKETDDIKDLKIVLETILTDINDKLKKL
jgi:hypothetical protein